MHRTKASAILLFLLISLSPSGMCQLRTFSQYTADRINTSQTHFILHKTGEAEFVWVSEWTHQTAYAYDGKAAIIVWHFKDGTKAYSQQGNGIGEFGKTTGYLITDKSSGLEDSHRKKIQPLTLTNFPVKIELWVGEIGDATGYAPEMQGDEACFSVPSIKYDTSYSFSGCRPNAKPE